MMYDLIVKNLLDGDIREIIVKASSLYDAIKIIETSDPDAQRVVIGSHPVEVIHDPGDIDAYEGMVCLDLTKEK